MKKTYTEQARAELMALEEMSESDINLDDVPEQTDWSHAERGKFFRPIKEKVTTRIDADVLAWLKRDGKGYQTRINAILRKEMQQQGVGPSSS